MNKTIEFKIINGIPEEHSFEISNYNKVYLKVIHKGKLAKFNFECSRESFVSAFYLYLGVLIGTLITDINSSSCDVEAEIYKIN